MNEISNSNLNNNKNNNYNLNEKIFHMMNILTIRLGITDSNFNPLIANCMGLKLCLKYTPKSVVKYIFENTHFKNFLQMIQNIYETLLCDLYIYIEVSREIKEAYFLLKYRNIF